MSLDRYMTKEYEGLTALFSKWLKQLREGWGLIETFFEKKCQSWKIKIILCVS